MKKLLSVLLTGAMVMGLVACNKEPAKEGGEAKASAAPAKKEKVSLKVWGSQDDQEFLKERVEAFKTAHKDQQFDIQLGVVGEPEAQSKYLEDPTAAADVFAFPNDQLKELVKAGGLYQVTRPEDVKYIKEENTGADAFTEDGKLYAFPFAADNGYFMYYDSRVFSKDDVKDLDTMLAKAKAAGKKVFMDVSNGWYIASFFLGNGGKFSIDDKGIQKVDFNNANGLAAGEAIKAFTANEAFTTGDDNVLKAGFTDGTIAAGVSGTWNAADIKGILGDGYAATKLPEYTAGGKKVQMGSFAGYKGYGISAHTKSPVEAMDLARFLTSEESQAKRFAMRGTGPSNKKVAESEPVKKDIALAALLEQSKFAVSQNGVLGTFWTPAEAFGTAMESKDYSKSVQELLDAMVEQIQVADTAKK